MEKACEACITNTCMSVVTKRTYMLLQVFLLFFLLFLPLLSIIIRIRRWGGGGRGTWRWFSMILVLVLFVLLVICIAIHLESETINLQHIYVICTRYMHHQCYWIVTSDSLSQAVFKWQTKSQGLQGIWRHLEGGANRAMLGGDNSCFF